jgi:hypothetical protein
MIAFLLHPGDLALADWLKLLAFGLIFCAVPVVIVGLIIYKVFVRKKSV